MKLIADGGIPIRTITSYAIHHDTYIVVEGRTTETGSFNYSQAAARSNSENALVIWNDPQGGGGLPCALEQPLVAKRCATPSSKGAAGSYRVACFATASTVPVGRTRMTTDAQAGAIQAVAEATVIAGAVRPRIWRPPAPR